MSTLENMVPGNGPSPTVQRTQLLNLKKVGKSANTD